MMGLEGWRCGRVVGARDEGGSRTADRCLIGEGNVFVPHALSPAPSGLF